MQGQRRSPLNSFPDTVDLNQESLSNNVNTDHPTAWNNALNSVESRLPHNSRSVNTWDSGESSSSANLRETRSEERRFEPILSRDRVGNGLGGNQVMWGPLSMQNSGDIGTSSSHAGYFLENDDGSDSSMGSWGSPCKRKALEDTSSQPFPFPGGNTSFFPQPELVPHITPACHNASSSLNISSSAVNSQGVSRSEQTNPRFGLGMRGAVSDVVPHIGPARRNDGSGSSRGSVAETAENSTRNYGARVNLGNQEQVPFNLPSPGNAVRRSSARSFHQSSRSSEFGQTASLPTNLSNLPNQPHLMCGPGLTRNTPFPWNGTHNSRTGSSSSSFTLPGERGTGLREESGFRSTIRNNVENPMFGPVNETRNSIQEPTNWSLGSSSGPGGVGSSSRAAPGSSSRSFPTGWLPHHNSHQVRIPDFAPWALFSPSPVESEAGIPGAQFSQFAPGSSSSSSSPEETLMPSGASSQGHHQAFPRSALLMEVEDDDVNGWRSLAADIDGRQRLVSEIRQVLNAMRRGENLRAEDFMLFDPFINGVAELHDRHRDMRLDVDNMSYEELLALEEHIGDVNTGLSEETILQSMKQRKYLPFSPGAPSKLEPCCICQEEYVIGETIGTLDCGHDYHSNCIKQWLLQKNVCPICKMTALGN